MKNSTKTLKNNNKMKGETTMKKTMTIIALVVTLIVSSITPIETPITEAPTAQAAVSNGIVYDGEGSTQKVLSTGSTAVASIKDCVPTIAVDGKDTNYPYTTPHAGTLVIADDDLLHMFWLTGHYVVIDLRTGKWLIAGQTGYDTAAMKVSYTKAASTKDASCVLGLTGKAIHTCIISNKYFYNENSNMMQLMTRAEFEALISGNPIATATPSAAPATTAPTAIPTAVPTEKPVIRTAAPAPTMAPMPTFAPSTMAPLPTFAPLPTAVVNPNDADTNVSIDIWYERFLRKEISWEQYWQATFGVNIDTKEHTESTTEATMKFLWDKFDKKEITFEQLQSLIWGNQWQAQKIKKGESVTTQIKDADGNVIGEKTEYWEQEDSQGTGSGTATTQTNGTTTSTSEEHGQGTAEVSTKTVSDTTSQTAITGEVQAVNKGTATVDEQEQGHAVVNASVKNNKAKTTKKTTSKAKKGKTKYYTIYPEGPKGAVNLTVSKNGKDSSVAGIRVDYTPKSLSKRYAYWDKEYYYGLIYAGFNNKGSAVIMVKQNSKYITYVLKRGKNKKAGKKYMPRIFKGYDKVVKAKVRGNAIRLKNSKSKKYIDIANLVPKQLKKAKSKK